ncbi:MAG: galactokinase, partial [Acidimicrobiia bacterium]|nr:galactokinase [Acidimicrobiia bacterium]
RQSDDDDRRRTDPSHPSYSQAVSDAFRRWAGGEPAQVWTAPGRVNLIGEHTDYNGGFVLPIAIDRYTSVAAGRRLDGRMRCHSLEVADDSDWPKYLDGVLRALAADGVEVGGADVLVTSTVPAGAGLSSSAALEVAAVAALSTLAGVHLDRRQLALVAYRAETEFVGVPVGIMDQTVVALAEQDHALFLDARSLETEQVRFDPVASGLHVVVVDSGIRRRLDDGRYAERRRECEEAAAALGVAQLRDATPGQVEDADLDDPLRRRARHVVTEDERVLQAVGVLKGGDVAGLGPLLLASHASLRDDFEVSIPELDRVVEQAIDAGALGARMTGGGFGGSALALVPHGALDAVFGRFGDAAFEVRPVGGVRRTAPMR